MKKLMILLLPFFYLLPIKNAFSDNLYQTEIDLIKKNQAIYAEVAEKKLAELDEISNIWKQIRAHTAKLKKIIESKINTTNKDSDESIRQLQQLSNEKFYVENVLVGLSVIKPKIEFLGNNLKIHLEKFFEIKEKNIKDISEVFKNINDLESNFQKRKQAVDANLKAWQLWQFEIAHQVQAKYQYQVMDHLEVIKKLNQINATFSSLNIRFYLALKNRQPKNAENILKAFVWLKSSFSFCFADKITTQSQRDLLNQVTKDADYKQYEMTNALKRQTEGNL